MLEIILLVGIGFFIGGVLKGATGSGAPLVAVPLLTLFYDPQTAIAIFAIPNVLPNIWQTWRFREHRMPASFLWRFAGCGLLGAIIGTVFLATLPSSWLSLGVALAVLVYVAFKVRNSAWKLPMASANRLAAPAGTIAGMLQGATGISAPVSITFLNAMGMKRERFVPTISTYFISVGVAQIPLLLWFNVLTLQWAMMGVLSLVPLIAGMPVGNWLARYISAAQFNRLTLAILVVLALGILADLWL